MPAGDTSECHGNGVDHCCFFAGTVCPYLRDDGPQPVGSRRWICTLFEEYRATSPAAWKDSRVWSEVHSDPRYAADVQPLWVGASDLFSWLWDEGIRCGNWPKDLTGITVTPGDDGYEWKSAWRDLVLAANLDINNNGYQWPKYSLFSCYGGRPEAGA